MDNDIAGQQAALKYKNEFGEKIATHIYLYQEKEPDFELEDFLDNSDKEKLKKVTHSTDVKRAFGFLFYDYKSDQKDFIKNLSKKSLSNLKNTLKRIEKI